MYPSGSKMHEQYRVAKRTVSGNKMNSLKWGMLQSQVANGTVSSGECIPWVANVTVSNGECIPWVAK